MVVLLAPTGAPATPTTIQTPPNSLMNISLYRFQAICPIPVFRLRTTRVSSPIGEAAAPRRTLTVLVSSFTANPRQLYGFLPYDGRGPSFRPIFRKFSAIASGGDSRTERPVFCLARSANCGKAARMGRFPSGGKNRGEIPFYYWLQPSKSVFVFRVFDRRFVRKGNREGPK